MWTSVVLINGQTPGFLKVQLQGGWGHIFAMALLHGFYVQRTFVLIAPYFAFPIGLGKCSMHYGYGFRIWNRYGITRIKLNGDRSAFRSWEREEPGFGITLAENEFSFWEKMSSFQILFCPMSCCKVKTSKAFLKWSIHDLFLWPVCASFILTLVF